LNILYILTAIFAVSVIGIFMPVALFYLAVVSLVLIVILAFKAKKQGKAKQSDTYKELEKIKKKRKKEDDKKYKEIKAQLNYIEKNWGYTQTQAKTIEKLLESRAYESIYRKLTISILPQLIKLIEKCNQKEQVGCKREVNKKISELNGILKDAIKEHKSRHQESYEISLEVLDRLMKEIKR